MGNISVQETEYKYIFSVVMAVYNCEPFLRETLDSIVNQDVSRIFKYRDGGKTKEFVPYEKVVQVIMVDDGSTDASGAICDEYAAKYSNFIAVHKPNGGVASARNEGLKYVEGKYMNFLDSDDKFSDNVLVSIYNFFEENYDKTDVVTMPLYYFDAVTGAHWQNYKFSKNNKVVDLFDNYNSPLMFVNASFFKSQYKDKVFFDGMLVCGEDIKYIATILSERMTMGLVSNCHYCYRRRSSGEESLIQTSKKKLGWYFDYFTHLVDWCVAFTKEKWGYIPYYYQNILVCDIKWRFLNEYDRTALELLGEEEFERYKQVLSDSLKHFEDKMILDQTGIWNEHKYMMFAYKYGKHAERCIYDDDIRLRFGNTLLGWMSGCYTQIDFIRIEDKKLIIEGYTTVLGLQESDTFDVYLGIRKKGENGCGYIKTRTVDRDASTYRLGEVLFRAVPFVGEVSLEKLSWAELNVSCFLNGDLILKKDIRYGRFSPIGKEYSKNYFYKDGYLVTNASYHLYVEKCNPIEKAVREKAFLKQLKKSGKASDKKAYYAIKLTKLMRKFKHKKIWLISDRIESAGDNGEALFKYLSSHPNSNVEPYFVINEDSKDFKRMSQYGEVVAYGSRKHKTLYLLADAIISSQSDAFISNPFNERFAPFRRYISQKKIVFLQHGITTNDLSKWFNRYSANFSGFVTAAHPEKDSILEYPYNYSEEQVWLTGFPRYDYLYNAPKKIIALMPTWRMYLVNNYNKLDDKKFLSSDYYQFYDSLLKDERLQAALEKHGYELYLKPHPRMLPYLDLLKANASFQLYDSDMTYAQIFAEAKLLVTDYSSTAMDFAYLKKPVVYCQFDAERFYSGEHTIQKGYFDYESDGFGEVEKTLEDTVDRIIEYLERDCEIKDVYLERSNRFFAFSDTDNSKRVVEHILNL